jgi:hypothetical protein
MKNEIHDLRYWLRIRQLGQKTVIKQKLPQFSYFNISYSLFYK